MVLLDTRVTSLWQMGHINGAIPMPYYYDDVEILAADLPGDGTWIVAYCECPRAAAESVSKKLRNNGFKNTAVLWEGFQGWVSLGYPISVGQSTVAPKLAAPEAE
jgi:rhodanese-related sulfurtransferase